MKLKVSVFEYLNQKVMYIQDVNYYFGIRDNFDIKLGDYELSEEEVLNIAKENDPEEYNELNIVESSEETMKKINGGCTIQIGRCLKDGSYYVVSLTNRCSNYVNHIAEAITYSMNNENLKPGKYGKKRSY